MNRAFVLLTAVTIYCTPPAVLAQQESAASVESVTAEDYYRADSVQAVRLTITVDDQAKMLAALPRRIYVPATFQWKDIVIPNVGVRFKGNSSSQPNQQHKRSYLVKFDEFEDDQRFLDLRRASFDNGVQFGSLFSEPMITKILRAEGVKVHRCNYAKLFVNDEYQGVYVNVERIDEVFIARQFGNADGPLYKVDEGGPGCNLQFIGDDPDAYKKAFESKSRAAKKERQRLVSFVRMVNHSQGDEFTRQLEAQLDVDSFLKVTAVMLYAGAFDQLTGWNPHNYYLYQDAETQKWTYFPWDLDVGFCETAFGRINVLADWHAAWPVPRTAQPNPLLERVITTPALLARYRTEAERILNQHFEPDKLCAAFAANYELIRGDLKTDPFPHRRVTVPTDQNYDTILESIKDFVRKRYAQAREQLSQPGERPKRAPQTQHGMPPQLAQKIQQVHRTAQQMQKDGKDLRPLQRIMQQIGPLMQQGKPQEAEKVVDEALKFISSGA